MKNNPKTRRRAAALIAAVLVSAAVSPALADGDPIAVVNNLSDFLFGLIRAVGIILMGFGILQLGLSLKSHDPSARANGITKTALLIVGDAVRQSGYARSKLYHPSFETGFRKAREIVEQLLKSENRCLISDVKCTIESSGSTTVDTILSFRR